MLLKTLPKAVSHAKKLGISKKANTAKCKRSQKLKPPRRLLSQKLQGAETIDLMKKAIANREDKPRIQWKKHLPNINSTKRLKQFKSLLQLKSLISRNP
jgi:phosphohistidine phosphatase SixA